MSNSSYSHFVTDAAFEKEGDAIARVNALLNEAWEILTAINCDGEDRRALLGLTHLADHIDHMCRATNADEWEDRNSRVQALKERGMEIGHAHIGGAYRATYRGEVLASWEDIGDLEAWADQVDSEEEDQEAA